MFYDKFYMLCQAHGVTPTKVARDLGIRQSTVSMWKKQGTTPKYETAKKLANYFNVSVDNLTGESGEIVNAGSYKDGAIIGVRIRPKEGEEYVEMQYDAKKLSLFELNALVEVFTRISEKYGMSIDALAYLAEASANAIASLPREEAEKAQSDKALIHRLTENIFASEGQDTEAAAPPPAPEEDTTPTAKPTEGPQEGG